MEVIFTPMNSFPTMHNSPGKINKSKYSVKTVGKIFFPNTVITTYRLINQGRTEGG